MKNIPLMKCSCLFFFPTLLLWCSSVANADVITTFDSDLEGWTTPNPVEISWRSVGGNPDGYLHFQDMSGISANSFLLAPSAYLGDLSALNGPVFLTYDHRIFETGGSGNNILPYEVQLEGPSGAARWRGSTPTGATLWTTVVVPYDQTEWQVLSGSWSDLLANVTSMKIRIEQVDNNISGRDISGIDNIRLATTAVPEPSSLLLMSLAGVILASGRRKQRRS